MISIRMDDRVLARLRCLADRLGVQAPDLARKLFDDVLEANPVSDEELALWLAGGSTQRKLTALRPVIVETASARRAVA